MCICVSVQWVPSHVEMETVMQVNRCGRGQIQIRRPQRWNVTGQYVMLGGPLGMPWGWRKCRTVGAVVTQKQGGLGCVITGNRSQGFLSSASMSESEPLQPVKLVLTQYFVLHICNAGREQPPTFYYTSKAVFCLSMRITDN